MTQFPAGDQRLLRSINERAVLEHIDSVGSATRADITRSTGLSKPTVALALATLGDRGWVQETGSVIGRKGPVAALYSVRPEAGFAVGIVFAGSGEIRSATGTTLPVTRGQVLAIPADFGDWSVSGAVQFIACRPGAGWPATLAVAG